MGALDDLRAVSGVMLDAAGEGGNASVVRDDPDWRNLECTRRHTALMWKDLNEAVTAETGSALSRELSDWDETWNPIIVTSEPDDFVEDWAPDSPWGWLPLAQAHRRETGWSGGPLEESGTWIGWLEPQTAWNCEAGHNLIGVLPAFIVVTEGGLRFAHTVTGRRREGLARRLVEYAVAHHGVTTAFGPFTGDGDALSRSLGLR